MSSFPVPRTRLPVCFLSPLPDSLPQLFLRCLPCALAFGTFCFRSTFFRLFPFRFRLLGFLFLPFLFLPVSASQRLPRCCLSAFQLPCFSTSVPPGFPCFSFVSLYSAFCLFPFIPPGFAPTAVPPVLPLCSRSRTFPSLPFSFVHFRSVLTTQSSVLSFPFFPFSPDGGSTGASFLFRPACFHAFLPIPVLSFLHFLSPSAVSPHSGYLSTLAFFLSVPGLFPLAFALGSGYLALGMYPFGYFLVASSSVVPSATLCMLSQEFLYVNNFFRVSAFLYIFNTIPLFFYAIITNSFCRT